MITTIKVIFMLAALMFCAFMIGYTFGYENCHEYVKKELNKYKEGKNGRDNTEDSKA